MKMSCENGQRSLKTETSKYTCA